MKTPNPIRIAAWIMLLPLLAAGCQKTSSDPEPGRDENLQTILDQTLTKYNGKGVSATIIFDAQDRWSGASGVYNISDNTELWEAVFNEPSKSWTPDEILSGYLEALDHDDP